MRTDTQTDELISCSWSSLSESYYQYNVNVQWNKMQAVLITADGDKNKKAKSFLGNFLPKKLLAQTTCCLGQKLHGGSCRKYTCQINVGVISTFQQTLSVLVSCI